MRQVNFRVSEDERERLEVLSGGKIAAYCREAVLGRMDRDRQFEQVLDRQGTTERQLSEITRLLANGLNTQSNDDATGLPVELVSCIFETLYLLRIVTQPAQRDQAKSAIERLGLPYIYNKAISDVAAKASGGGKKA